MSKMIHYAISANNPSPSLCGRITPDLTRIKGCVSCKQCKKLMESKEYSISQFVEKAEK